MNKRSVIVVATAAAILIGAVVYVISVSGEDTTSTDREPQATAIRLGALAPNFELPTIDDRTITLSSTRGHPVVVAFGASWCHPCRNEYPMLQAALDADPELRVVGVMQRDSPGLMQLFMDDVGAKWPVGDDAQQQVARQYGVRGLPDTYFLDATGHVRAHVVGEMSQADLDKHLATIRDASR